MLDAAPYVVQFSGTASISASLDELELYGASYEKTIPFTVSETHEPPELGVPFGDASGASFYEELRVTFEDNDTQDQDGKNIPVTGTFTDTDADPILVAILGSAAFTNTGAVAYHEDDDGNVIGQPDVGQPDAARILVEGETYGQSDLFEDGPITVSVSATSDVSARIRIWDADCPHVGTPVTGEWSLASSLMRESAESSLSQQVTIRYWKAINDIDPLVLDSTLSFSVPPGIDEFDESLISQTFELTTGSEIEVEISSHHSATGEGKAKTFDFTFSVTADPINQVDVLNFEHYEQPSGDVDAQTLAIEYEILHEHTCYYDLELGTRGEGESTPTTFDSFRIDHAILDSSPRFRIADPDTGLIRPNTEAFELGRHVLLVDGNSPSLQAPFADLNAELIEVYEPEREEFGKAYHGFFQSTPVSPLVIRSDADTLDSILLEDLSASFDFGGDVTDFDFPLESVVPAVTKVPSVIVMTAGGDDEVFAAPEFAVPIVARLGDGSDVFVGGAGQDDVRGGGGSDVLLGEGWEGDVTQLQTLFDDMKDLKFTFAAGLEPADGSDDSLFGELGDDFLLGGAGDDTLDAGPGAAGIFGDSLSVNAAVTVDIDNLEFGTDIDFTRSGAGMDTITAGDSHTIVIAGGGDDTILGNTAGTSLLFGNAGDDTITSHNSFAVIAGGDGGDMIDGSGFLIGDSFSFSTFRSDIFDALKNGSLSAGVQLTAEDSGDDTIQGGDGFDFIVGGDGNDGIDGGDGLNIVFGDAFDLTLSVGLDFADLFSFDSVFSIFAAPLAILDLFEFEFEFAGTGSDVYNGGSDTDVAFGGDGDDTLNGNSGLDFLVGGAGHDDVDAGDDYFFSVEFGDVGFGGPGNDTITGSAGADFLESELGNDTFFGLAGNDTIFGGAGADVLNGGPGDDRLYGEGGDDEINGGDGDDDIFGGTGVDTLDGGTGNNSVNQDPVPPQVIAIGPSPGAENPTNASSVEFTVVFDASVSGIEPADFPVATTGSATGTVAGVSATTGQTVTVTVNGVGGIGRVGLDFDADASGGVTDSLGHVSTEDFAGAYYVVGDLIKPSITVNIVDSVLNDSDNTSAVTFEFSEDVVDFDATDIAVVAGTLNNFMAIDGDSYSATFTANDAFSGVGSVTVQANSYLDVPGNKGSMGTDSVDIDTLSRYVEEVENFDTVTAPNLPSGWTTISTASNAWTTVSGDDSNSPPNHAFVVDIGETSDSRLVSPLLPIPSNVLEFRFLNDYDTESSYDGGLLEISIDGGEFVDILAAGGSFVEGGYTGAVAGLGGSDGWTGSSGGYIDTVVDLPGSALGKDVQFQWRLGTDSSVGDIGWRIDDIQLKVVEIPMDFGDAPDATFPTLLASDGARHVLGSELFMGASVDADSDGQPNASATGDDSDGSDDEDGVTINGLLVPGQPASFTINASAPGLVDAWIDLNGDGMWTHTDEQFLASEAVVTGNNTFSDVFPADASFGLTTLRFRISSSGGLLPTGAANDGEVEDYQATIETVNRFVVNSTGDLIDNNLGDGVCNTGGTVGADPECTLRAATQQANSIANLAAGPDVIIFNIPGTGPHTISPASLLPNINDPVVIDGTTEPDFLGTPIVEIDGTAAGAGSNGLRLLAGNSTVRGLVINRFNASGIKVESNGNLIAGNYIGTDIAGTTAMANSHHGVMIFNGSNNTLGGITSADRNLISGNTINGVNIIEFGGTATGNLIQGNFIGTDATGTVALGNSFNGFRIFGGNNNTLGGTLAGARNVISGNGSIGVVFVGSADSNLVQGNFIGTDATGNLDRGNTFEGVLIVDSSLNSIGGAASGAGNLISGNNGSGVRLEIADNNVVSGNQIGTDVGGSLDRGNNQHGVSIFNSSGNTIGGTAAGAGNTISGNNLNGVSIIQPGGGTATGNLLQGNTIGLDSGGTTALGNDFQGVRIFAGDNNTLGGTTASARNLISSNGQAGVKLEGNANGNTIQGNRIGTDTTGTLDRGNDRDGVWLDNSSTNTIGGTVAGAGNLISGNGRNGILLAYGPNGNVIQGNTIGTQVDGTTALGNNRAGVSLFQASNTTIGGTVVGEPNIVAFSGIAAGVEVTGGTSAGNAIRQNSIFNNATLGIEVGLAGVSANDADDPDVGPNQKQNFPALTTVVLTGGNLDITYSVPTITPNATFPLSIDFFITDGLTRSGKTFLGSATYNEGTTPTATVSAGGATAGTLISATATDANGNTSEFSNPGTVTTPLRAASQGTSVESQELQPTQLQPIVNAAISIWQDAGLTTEQVNRLRSVDVQIDDLSGNLLGVASNNTIVIDTNAAGFGWFVDSTPLNDSEFTVADTDALDQMDLLTAVLHEFGHILELADVLVGHDNDLMLGWLQAGTRRLP